MFSCTPFHSDRIRGKSTTTVIHMVVVIVVILILALVGSPILEKRRLSTTHGGQTANASSHIELGLGFQG